MTLTFMFDFDSVKVNQRDRYLK